MHVLRTLRGREARITAVSFSPDGQQVLTASSDHTVRRWPLHSSGPAQSLGQYSFENSVLALWPERQLLVTQGSNDTAVIWEAQTGHESIKLKGHGDTVTDAALSADGQRIVTSGLKPHDVVVVNGLQRVRPGSLLAPTPTKTASN